MFPLKSNFKQRLRFWVFFNKRWMKTWLWISPRSLRGKLGRAVFTSSVLKKVQTDEKFIPLEKNVSDPLQQKKWDAKVLFEKHFLVRNCLEPTRDSFGSWVIASSKKVCYLLLFGRWSLANIKARSRSLLETTAPIGTLKLSRIEQHW